jgi:hypothetical protein
MTGSSSKEKLHTWHYRGYCLVLKGPLTPEEEKKLKAALDRKRREEAN